MLDDSGPVEKIKKIKPLSPKEVADKKEDSIPDKLIEAANNLIIKNWDGYGSTVKLKDLINEYLRVCHKKINESNRSKAYKLNLNIENRFRKAGWKVTYDSPSYGDSDFDSYFKFTKS